MTVQKRKAKPAVKNDDSVIYKVMAALLYACIESLTLQRICTAYDAIDTMEIVHDRLFPTGCVLAGAALAAIIAAVLLRKKPGAKFGFILTGINLALFAGCCIVLYHFWTGPATAMYFAFFALAFLCGTQLLYQPDFFWLTFGTFSAGFVFYFLSQVYGTGSTLLAILLNVLLVVIELLLLLAAHKAVKNNGWLTIGKRRVHFLTLGNPTPLYTACIVWLICLAACALLGNFFCICCVFAAAAFELAFAVYYTVKLK